MCASGAVCCKDMLRFLRARFLFAFLVVLIAVSSVLIEKTLTPRVLTVSFLNVGDGEAILVRTPSGNTFLINAGPDARVLRELGTTLPFWLRRIDAGMSTSVRAGDMAGFAHVFPRYRTSQYFVAPEIEQTHTSAAAAEAARTHDVQIEPFVSGMRIELADGVIFDVAYAGKDGSVVKLSYGETAFLFIGNLAPSARAKLAAAHAADGLLSAHVLAIPGRGAESALDEAWLHAVRPAYAVISVGKDNRYGYPDEKTFRLLNSAGTKVLRTDMDGRIPFTSDGRTVEMEVRTTPALSLF